MKAFISIFKNPDEIEVRVRAEGRGDWKAVGDMLRVVKPGGSYEGVSYDDLLKQGEGACDWPITPAPVQS